MRIPISLTLSEVQSAFRDAAIEIDRFTKGNPDLHGRKYQNVGEATEDDQWVTRGQGDARWLKIEDLPAQEAAPSITAVRIDTFALRGPAAMFPNTIFEASDRNYQAWVSTGQKWLYAYGVYQRTQSQLSALAATLGTDDTGLEVWVTDYEHHLKWTGSAWVFAPGDPGSGWVAIGKPAGTAPNGGVWGLCDGTAYNVLNADGTTTSLTTQNLTGDVFIKGKSTSGSQQSATRATWESSAATDAANTGGSVSTSSGSVNGGDGASASFLTSASFNEGSHSHPLSDTNAQLKVPSESNGGLPLRIACVFYIRR
jgi:hypothetical protein